MAPPKPQEEASTAVFVSLFGSYKATAGTFACQVGFDFLERPLLLTSLYPMVPFVKQISDGLCLVSRVF